MPGHPAPEVDDAPALPAITRDGEGSAAPRAPHRPAHRSRLTHRSLRVWAIGSLLAAGALAGVVWLARPARVPVTDVVRRDVVRTLVLTGRVRPPARPRLGVSVSGTVRQVLAREGGRVRRGQVLLRIDDARPAADVTQARAALAQVEARSRSTAEQAELAFRQASRDADRARSLFAQGAISRRELEVAERAAADARSELDAARARAADGGPSRLAEVARARGALAAAEAQLALTRLTAPGAGTVLTRAVEPGDAVLPGQVLFELALDGPTELVAFALEEDLAELSAAGAARASADAFPSRAFDARVRWLAPVVDPAQGTVEVRLAVPAPPPYLRADMTVSIEVEVARRAGALVVPRALVRDATSGAPWVAVARDGRAVRRAVRLGVAGDREVEIVAGLAEGEQVLPAGVAPGARVRVARGRGW